MGHDTSAQEAVAAAAEARKTHTHLLGVDAARGKGPGNVGVHEDAAVTAAAAGKTKMKKHRRDESARRGNTTRVQKKQDISPKTGVNFDLF